jgi:serpin B
MLGTLGYEKTAPGQVNEAHRSIRALLGNIDPSVQLRIANSIWARQGVAFKPEFMSVNEQSYGAKTTTLEFGDPEAKNVINRWVKEATEGKIGSMVEKLSRDDVMVLLNAVYFKGTWKSPFNKDLTKTATFKAAEGKVYDVPMMNQRSRVGYTEGKDWKAISMPYGNGKIEMVVVLPGGDLDALVKGLAEGSHKALGDMKETPVVIALPKFQVNYEETLNDALKKLGMKLAFGGGADFSNLSEEKLFISEVKHKTFLEVDEVGSEAGGATSVTITRTSAPIDEKSFVVDRPFAFMIREKQTGLVLFAGAVRSIGQLRP